MDTSPTSPEPEEATTLGDYIRAVRLRAGLSQRQVATRAGFHHSLLARLEAGEVSEQPKPENLQRLADALEIDSADLLAFLGIKPSVPEPRLYFRKAYNLSDEDAEAAARQVETIIANLRAHHNEKNKEGGEHA